RPAAAANAWHCASAPARPPRFAPSPLPALVTKNDIGCGGCCAGGCARTSTVGMAAMHDRTVIRIVCILHLQVRCASRGRAVPDSSARQDFDVGPLLHD